MPLRIEETIKRFCEAVRALSVKATNADGETWADLFKLTEVSRLAHNRLVQRCWDTYVGNPRAPRDLYAAPPTIEEIENIQHDAVVSALCAQRIWARMEVTKELMGVAGWVHPQEPWERKTDAPKKETVEKRAQAEPAKKKKLVTSDSPVTRAANLASRMLTILREEANKHIRGVAMQQLLWDYEWGKPKELRSKGGDK